jgi:(p)ppGpp synthase/HD superfamily hydrolase
VRAPQGLGSIAEERASRLRSRSNNGSEAEGVFEQQLSLLADGGMIGAAREAFDFAKGLDYAHPGLSAASYLAHPVRVMCLLAQHLEPLEKDGLVLALLHNAFEVTDVAADLVAGRFGQPVADGMIVLTVDRRRQSSAEYRWAYYEGIGQSPRWVRVVKVMDKLDNLFLLGLNPDELVRANYLLDIEEFILPLVRADVPHLEPYFVALIEDCRALGHFESDIQGA